MNTKTPLSKKFWWSLVLFGLTGQVAWVVENMYLNVFIYKMFYNKFNYYFISIDFFHPV